MSKQTPLKVTDVHRPLQDKPLALPVFSTSVQAGFPSPAEDHIEKRLDINELVVQHPTATFFVRVEGESMIDANIHSGDILVVDRSIQPTHGKIVIAILDGEFTVKRLKIASDGVFLMPENPKYPGIQIESGTEFQIWGVVTYVIHKAK